MILLGPAALIALILLAWFKTEAFVEYGRFLRFPWAKLEDYQMVRTADPSLKYLKFLSEYFDCFFVRLITCPICSGVWLGLLIGLLLVPSAGLMAIPSVTYLGLLLYYSLAMLVSRYA